jgi:hypothetical protein
MSQLALIMGWVLTIFVGLLGLVILWLIIIGRISLDKLISDEQGNASLARFQFLVFTFVIALTLAYLVFRKEPAGDPDIPGQVLALLGISGASYTVAKGIQSSRDIGLARTGTGDGGVNPQPGATQPPPRTGSGDS